MKGIVYLLHFQEPYHHARRYVGWTLDLESRLEEHRAGCGARLIQVILEAGIDFELVRTWEGDRRLERRLKRSYHGPPVCPKCNPERALHRANWEKKDPGEGQMALPFFDSPEEEGSYRVVERESSLGESVLPDDRDDPDDLFSEERWTEICRRDPLQFLNSTTKETVTGGTWDPSSIGEDRSALTSVLSEGPSPLSHEGDPEGFLRETFAEPTLLSLHCREGRG